MIKPYLSRYQRYLFEKNTITGTFLMLDFRLQQLKKEIHIFVKNKRTLTNGK